MQGRKLTQDEVAALGAKHTAGTSRRVVAELYDSLVADFDAGEYGEVVLGADEKKPTVRKHVSAAFDRKGLKINWRRGGKNTLRFHVL